MAGFEDKLLKTNVHIMDSLSKMNLMLEQSENRKVQYEMTVLEKIETTKNELISELKRQTTILQKISTSLDRKQTSTTPAASQTTSSSSGGFSSKTLELIQAASEFLKPLGIGLVWLAGGILALAGALLIIPVASIPAMMITAIGMTFVINQFLKLNLEAAESISESLIKLGFGIFTFGLAIAVSTPLYVVGIPGLLLAAGSIWLISKVINSIGGMEGSESVSKGLIHIGFGIFSLALGIAAWNILGITAASAAVPVLFMLGVYGVVLLMNSIAGTTKDNNPASSILAMAAGIGILGLSIKLWEVLGITGGTALLVLATMAGFAAVMWIIGNTDADKGAKALLLSSISIAAIGLAVYMWQTLAINWETIAMVGATVGGIALITYMAGKFSGEMLKGSLVLILASVPIMMLAYSMEKWMTSGVTWESIGQVLALTAGVGVEMGIAGLASPFILAGSLAMIAAAYAIQKMVDGLTAFKKIGWNEDDTKGIVGAIGGVTRAITGVDKREGGFVSKFLGAVGDMVVGAVDSAALIANSLALSYAGDAIKSISIGLGEFKKTNFKVEDGIALSSTIAGVIGAFSILTDTDKQKALGININPLTLGIAIDSLSGIGNTISSLAEGVRSFANLTFLKRKYDPKTGKLETIEEVKLSDADIQAAANNITFVIKTLIEPFAKVGEMEANSSGWFTGGYISKGIDAIAGMGKNLSELAGGIQSFANLNIVKFDVRKDKNGRNEIVPVSVTPMTEGDFTNASTNISKVLGFVATEFAKVGKMESEGSGWFSGGFVSKGVGAISGMGENLVNLAKSIQDFANLSFTEYEITKDSTGKMVMTPKKIHTLDEGSFEIARQNISKVLGLVLGEIINAGKMVEQNESTIEIFKTHFKFINESFTSIINTIKSSKEIEGIKIDSITGSIGSFIKGISDMFDPETQKNLPMKLYYMGIFTKHLENITKNQTAMEKLSKSFESISKSMGNFKESVNSIDIEKIKHIDNIFSTSIKFLEKRDENQVNKLVNGLGSEMKGIFETGSQMANTGSNTQSVSSGGTTGGTQTANNQASQNQNNQAMEMVSEAISNLGEQFESLKNALLLSMKNKQY